MLLVWYRETLKTESHWLPDDEKKKIPKLEQNLDPGMAGGGERSLEQAQQQRGLVRTLGSHQMNGRLSPLY